MYQYVLKSGSSKGGDPDLPVEVRSKWKDCPSSVHWQITSSLQSAAFLAVTAKEKLDIDYKTAFVALEDGNFFFGMCLAAPSDVGEADFFKAALEWQRRKGKDLFDNRVLAGISRSYRAFLKEYRNNPDRMSKRSHTILNLINKE